MVAEPALAELAVLPDQDFPSLAQDDGGLFLEVVEKEGRDGHGRLTVEHHVRCKLCNRFATDDHLCQPVHRKKYSRFSTDSLEAHAKRTLALAFTADGPPGRLDDFALAVNRQPDCRQKDPESEKNTPRTERTSFLLYFLDVFKNRKI